MTRLDELTLLKSLDPAAGSVDANSPRARADLQRILTTDPTTPTTPARQSQKMPGVRQNRRPVRRIAVGAGLVAAITAAAIVLPSVLGGDQAFATWTGTPATMSSQESANASATCRAQGTASAPEYGPALKGATTALSERRGTWTLVVLVGRGGFSGFCINDTATAAARSSYLGFTSSAELPGRRELKVGVLGASELNGKYMSSAVGLAGADVTGITYTSAKHGKVKATVAGGQYALWLPGKELERAIFNGVPLQVTYRDGTTTTTVLKG